MRKIFLIAICLLLSGGLTSAQTVNLPLLNGYKKVTNYPVYGPENLWDFINGAADAYLALGFVDLNVAEYKKGKNVIKLEVYRLSNHTTTFGIYSSERSSSFRYLNLGSQGYIIDGAINFFKGNYYVKIRTFSKSEKVIQAAESLAQKISVSLDGESDMPSVLGKFPETGKKENEETFINESVLGHKFLNRAFKADYEIGPDNFSIYIIANDNAMDTQKTASDYLIATGNEAAETETGKYMLNDKYNGIIFMSWKETTIVIISGLSKDQTDIADLYSSEILK